MLPLARVGPLRYSAGRSSMYIFELKAGTVWGVRPDTPWLLVRLVLVAQGLKFRFHLAMMVHILAGPHVMRGTDNPLRPGVMELLALLKPSHEATDDGQAGLPRHILGSACTSLVVAVGVVVVVDAEAAKTG